jgi:hypothetical protein
MFEPNFTETILLDRSYYYVSSELPVLCYDGTKHYKAASLMLESAVPLERLPHLSNLNDPKGQTIVVQHGNFGTISGVMHTIYEGREPIIKTLSRSKTEYSDGPVKIGHHSVTMGSKSGYTKQIEIKHNQAGTVHGAHSSFYFSPRYISSNIEPLPALGVSVVPTVSVMPLIEAITTLKQAGEFSLVDLLRELGGWESDLRPAFSMVNIKSD